MKDIVRKVREEEMTAQATTSLYESPSGSVEDFYPGVPFQRRHC